MKKNVFQRLWEWILSLFPKQEIEIPKPKEEEPIPEVLVILNAAIANRYFDFPTGKVTAHKNFRLIAAGNTTGTGSECLFRKILSGWSISGQIRSNSNSIFGEN